MKKPTLKYNPVSKYPIISSQQEYKNDFFSVRHEHVDIKGKPAHFYVVEKNHDGVWIIPYTQNKILLIRQYRQHVRHTAWEVVAGGSTYKGEDPIGSAQRELTEETGYVGQNCKIIGTFFLVPGLSDMIGHVVVAETMHTGTLAREFSEDISEQKWFDIDTVKSMILNGKIVDGMSITALHYFFLHHHV